jgi:hypothetical protein
MSMGVGTVAIDVVKSDGTTELLHLKDVLHCPNTTIPSYRQTTSAQDHLP